MFLFLKLFFSFSNAAKATALEGSTTIFIRSHINFIALIISSSLTRIIVDCPGGDLILGISWDFQNAFNGKLDDIGIWDRALTQQEITHLYNGCQLIVNSQPSDPTVVPIVTFSFTDSLTVAAYQWQMDAGTGYTDLSNAGQFSGTDTDTLDYLLHSYE